MIEFINNFSRFTFATRAAIQMHFHPLPLQSATIKTNHSRSVKNTVVKNTSVVAPPIELLANFGHMSQKQQQQKKKSSVNKDKAGARGRAPTVKSEEVTFDASDTK